MKKIIVTTAVTGLLLAACNKKNVNPAVQNEIKEKAPISIQNYKYSQDIRIYDDSKTYYMDISVKANDQKAFDANVAYLNNSKLELINKKPEPENNSTLKTAPQNSTTIKPNKDEAQVYIDIKKISKGEAKGVRLTSGKTVFDDQVNKMDFLYGSNGFTIIHVGPCSYYTMYGYTFNHSMWVHDYYWDNGMIYLQTKSVVYNNTTIFSGFGYLDRFAYCHGSGNWVIDLYIWA